MHIFDIPTKSLCIITDRPIEAILGDKNLQKLRTYHKLTFVTSETAMYGYYTKYKGGPYYFQCYKEIAEMAANHDATVCIGISPLQAKPHMKPHQKLYHGKMYEDIVEFGKDKPISVAPKVEPKPEVKVEAKTEIKTKPAPAPEIKETPKVTTNVSTKDTAKESFFGKFDAIDTPKKRGRNKTE